MVHIGSHIECSEIISTHERNRSHGRDFCNCFQGIEGLLAAIDQALVADPLVDAELVVPQSEGAALAAIEAGMVIHSRAFEGDLVHLAVRGPASLVGRIKQGLERR